MAAGFLMLHMQGHGPLLDAVLPLPARVAAVASYLVGTFLVTPDLDLANRSVRAKSNWGVFGWMWLPYGAVFRHRGLSHSWIVGPLTRIMYLIILGLALMELVSIAGGALGVELRFRTQLAGNWLPLLYGTLVGYYVSQWLHLLVDHTGPRARRRR